MRTHVLTILIFFFFSWEVKAHPVHISLSSVEISEGESVMAIKVFKDDLQLAVYHHYGVEIPLEEIGSDEHTKDIENYLKNCFLINLNKTKELKLEFRNSESNEEAIWLYFNTEMIPHISEITVTNRIFLDIYPDQTNLLIINHYGKQKGYRFDLKTTKMDISFL